MATYKPNPCTVPGCIVGTTIARGLCRGHYERFLRYGDAEHATGRRIGGVEPPACSAPGCHDVAKALGYCSRHYYQARRTGGEVGAPIKARQPSTARDPSGRKMCRSCRDWLPEASFAKQARAKDGLQSDCRACRSQHYKSKAETIRDSMRERRFGISRDEFDAMLASQGGGCAICGATDPGASFWATDHDHACCPGEITCGKCVRGILCRACNHGLGNFADDVGRMEAAINYLNTTRRIVR